MRQPNPILPRLALRIGLAALIVGTAACGGDGGASSGATTTVTGTGVTTSSSASTSSSPATSTTLGIVDPALLAPLTGLPYTFGNDPSRPALAVKIDGAREAQPQVGLDVADIVYEEPVEGLIRYIAVFQSRDPGDVGPIRSARPMDANIIQPLNGVFVISGGIGAFVSSARKVSELLDTNAEGFFRAGDRRNPHNLLAHAAELWNQRGEKVAPTPQFVYAPANAPQPTGAPICSVDIVYNNQVKLHYDLDPTTGLWLRSINGQPHTAASGALIAPRNLIVQRVSLKATQYVDAAGTKVLETIVLGSGEAAVYTAGREIVGTWDRPDAAFGARYLDGAGSEIALRPGQTWVHLLPPGATVTVSPECAPDPPIVATSTTRPGVTTTTKKS